MKWVKPWGEWFHPTYIGVSYFTPVITIWFRGPPFAGDSDPFSREQRGESDPFSTCISGWWSSSPGCWVKCDRPGMCRVEFSRGAAALELVVKTFHRIRCCRLSLAAGCSWASIGSVFSTAFPSLAWKQRVHGCVHRRCHHMWPETVGLPNFSEKLLAHSVTSQQRGITGLNVPWSSQNKLLLRQRQLFLLGWVITLHIKEFFHPMHTWFWGPTTCTTNVPSSPSLPPQARFFERKAPWVFAFFRWQPLASGSWTEIVGFPPKSSILIGFSIIFTIHFGVYTSIFGNTHIFPILEDHPITCKWLGSPPPPFISHEVKGHLEGVPQLRMLKGLTITIVANYLLLQVHSPRLASLDIKSYPWGLVFDRYVLDPQNISSQQVALDV